MTTEGPSSYTWPLSTITAIESLRTSAMLARLVVDSARADAIAETKRRLVKATQRAAEPWAVIPHPGDFTFDETEPDDFHVRIECAWRPSTREAELRGGPADGQLVTIQRVGDPVEVVVPRSPLSLMAEPGPVLELDPLDSRYTYRLSGWAEATRRWVYEQ